MIIKMNGANTSLQQIGSTKITTLQASNVEIHWHNTTQEHNAASVDIDIGL